MLRLFAPVLVGTALFTVGAQAQNKPASAAPESPYGGVTVEDVIARVNDQIISRTDYERALKEADDEARQRGASMQQIADGHKDLLRNLIDQQLWLSKGKELGITGDTEVVKQLDEIRKKYNLASMEDLEKAAKDQGISFEDFKANIRNQIVTQQVMRDEVGRRVQFTPGEAQRYFEAHKDQFAQPESVHLAEIMISSGADGSEDPQKLASAKAKADDIEAKLKAGGNFDQIARTSSDGQTAAEGGDMGKFAPGQLNKAFEDKTFGLKDGEVTDPIRTKQGYVIFKVINHVHGGVPQYKDVEPQVEEAYYESRMEPAMRGYLTQMREEAYIQVKDGYVDSAATPNEIHPTITYNAYTPPAPKKKKKVERTRFRETEHGFRNKNNTAGAALVPASADTTPTKASDKNKKGKDANAAPLTMKAGKKEKIRYGQAPRETLPNAPETKVEDAGALPKAAGTEEADNSNAPVVPVKKTRYADRSKEPKAAKPKGPQLDSFTPLPPDASEVADRQTQTAPLGLNGDTSKKKKKKQATATEGEKTRMQDRPKDTTEKAPLQMTPTAPVAGAPAPLDAPKTTSPKPDPAPNSPSSAPVPSSFPQQTPTSPDPPLSTTPQSEPPH